MTAAGALNGLKPIALRARASSARVGGAAGAAVFQRLKQRWMSRLAAYRRKMQAAVFQRAK